ncbi:unnamed protein product [Mytilus edulis]|uniref:Integrase catalytic domain-containing protein n=1 Tax=Mytilus edulis TaxID=6550 RepID=A0A8S3QVK8_MYTED|nr:unnamed protein product [Mytilus edulis]
MPLISTRQMKLKTLKHIELPARKISIIPVKIPKQFVGKQIILEPSQSFANKSIVGAACLVSSSTQQAVMQVINPNEDKEQPPVSLPHRAAPNIRTEIERQVEEMLKYKIIEPSNSIWHSPVCLTRQLDENGKERVISCSGRALRNNELNWTITEKECLADLEGRWALELQNYDFEIIYKEGKKNTNADALSRIPYKEIEDEIHPKLSVNSLLENKIKTEIKFEFGAPRAIVSDRGANFCSKLIQALCELFEVQRYHTSSYHPQTNSTCERMNRTIAQTLRTLVAKDQSNWHKLIPSVMMALRMSTNTESTGYSPFQMLFGKEMNLPFDISVQPKDEIIGIFLKSKRNIVENDRDRVDDIDDVQNDNIDRTQNDNAQMQHNDALLQQNDETNDEDNDFIAEKLLAKKRRQGKNY